MSDYDKLAVIADKIAVLVEKGLDVTGNDEPCRTPLLNLRGDVSHLRDAIKHAEGQVRVDA